MALKKVRTWVRRLSSSKTSCLRGGIPSGHSVRARPTSFNWTALILTFLVTLRRSLPLSRAVPAWSCRRERLSWSKPERKTVGSASRMEQETPLPDATGLGTSETMDEAEDFVDAGGGRTVT